MFISDIIGIIADDLTGANDTALQFHLRGCNTQIILNQEYIAEIASNTQAWAISTQTRNTTEQESYLKVQKAAKMFQEKLNVENFYKKIDSTLRGNIAVEALTMLDTLNYDAAIVVPAFPNEGRTTVGGYHLLKAIPIERTELAIDPHFPIYESHIPTLLKSQLPDENKNLVDLIELKTVIKDTGPILMELNKKIKNNKKLIVLDAVSTVDLEQIVLASQKSTHKILICGSAGAANALGNIWIPELTHKTVSPTIPRLPKFIVSGSATRLSASQIKRLDDSDEFENTYFIPLSINDVVEGVSTQMVERVINNLGEHNIVVVHSSEIKLDDKMKTFLIDKELTYDNFTSKIVNYLALLTQKVLLEKEVILITMGGETSYECARAIDSEELHVIDACAPAIPLCIDHKAQWLVTKSGNLGNSNTLIEILKYFEQHENE